MKKLAEIWSNKWVRFAVVTVIYLLLFVVWTGNLYLLLGVLVIYDIYISKIMYRLFWRRHKELKKSKKSYKKIMEWVEAIVFAVVVVTFIRFFIFALYLIPTPSMEKSLLVGDYLYVSKLSYGPSVPNTPISFPLVHNTMPFSQTKASYSELIKWSYHRLKGFTSVKRGDAVVFNFPAGDTVVLERQAETYYDILRFYQTSFGKEEGRKRLYKEYTIVARPVDKRENYVKRCVAIPGDTLRILDSKVEVNGAPLKDIPTLQHDYYVRTNGVPISQNALSQMDIANRDVSYNQLGQAYELPLTNSNFERVKKMNNVIGTIQYVSENVNDYVFPHDMQRYPWSEDNFGPLWVPKKGMTAGLTIDNIALYSMIIEHYEGGEIKIENDLIYINGSLSDSYTFKMDYYFMMGDNRHNSADSRFWGFVPEDHIVGKALFVCMSLDSEKKFPANIRWSRIFKGVK